MANIFWPKQDIDNRTRTLESTRVSYTGSKLHELWYTSGLKLNRSFYPDSVFCSVPSPSHTLQASLTWHLTANLKETALGLFARCSSDSKPQKLQLGNGITSECFKWQCIVNCHFSSYYCQPDISSADIGFSAILLLVLLSSATLPAHWRELNQKRAHVRKWVRFKNVCQKFGISPSFKNCGTKTTFSTILSYLTTSLAVYIFGTQQMSWCTQWVCWKLQGVSYIVSKLCELWSINSLKLDRSYYPPSGNSAFTS